MNGYIIVAESEDANISDKYWNGLVFEETIEQAQFINNKISARGTIGGLQSKNQELDLKIVPAQLSIILGHAPLLEKEPVTPPV